ncbi:MAG: porin [Bacteroidales bacterium]
MRYTFMALAAMLISLSSSTLTAQAINESNQDKKISIRFDTRFDFQYTTYGKDKDTDIKPEDESGFVGRYLKLIIDGKISDKFSYSFRHRLYMNNGNVKEFFSATDWANITYTPNSKFSITAGKQMICIGTIEYDYAPIDVYFASDFWNHVSPFQVGVNVGFRPTDKHTIYAQVTNSPFSDKAFSNLYAFNAIWYGSITNWFKTIYSANMIEYEKGNYINYIALGNKFIWGNAEIDLDYMNRYAGKKTAFFEDFTLMGKISYQISNKFKIFAKGGYDQNKTQVAGEEFIYDRYVLPGVERGFYGAGAEYFPLNTSKNNLRIHAFWLSTTENPIPQTFNLGIKWMIKVLDR